MKFQLDKYFVVIVLVLLLLTSACSERFLDKLNDDTLVVPETLEDMQALLDNTVVMNGTNVSGGTPLPVLGEASTDDFYFEDNRVNAFSQVYRDLYLWSNSYTDNVTSILSWMMPYRAILYTNVVLDNLEKMELTTSNGTTIDNIRGSALFFRSYIYFHLAQVYAVPYDENAGETTGLPMRFSGDISQSLSRPNLADTYEHIVQDATTALSLLPSEPLYKTRPGKAAAHALLAKIFLLMADYERTAFHAESALAFGDDVLDYATLDETAEYPFERLNEEVIFHMNMAIHDVMGLGKVSVDLLNMYGDADLRKRLFYTQEGYFRGSYDGTSGLFGGLTTSENLLILAESKARLKDDDGAREYLNKLRKGRFRVEDYVDVDIDGDMLLDFIIQERRRELVLRGCTWYDLRRLNREARFQRVMKRFFDGNEYILEPGSTRYTFLIPNETIVAAGIVQNER